MRILSTMWRLQNRAEGLPQDAERVRRNGEEIKPSEIRFNGTRYRVVEVIDTGLTSVVYKTSDGQVVKQYRPRKSSGELEREVFWLERLKKTGVVPELLAVDQSSCAILMSDCGEPISTLNAPRDWEKQLSGLMEQLRANRCSHNDLSEHEVLVKDGRLRIVDFTFALENQRDIIPSPTNCIKRTRLFLDDHIVNYIRFRLYGAPPGSEPHCFVLWTAGEHHVIQKELERRFSILRDIVYFPNIITRVSRNRDAFFSNFYCGRPSVSGNGSHGYKGRTPFILYFVLDKNPRYEIRTNPFRGTQEIVNVNVFDLKTNLRGGRTSFLHGSDSIQECLDNLEALSIYAEGVPKSYWHRWRPRFASVADFFDHLNDTEGLDYVVLRNFDDLVENRANPISDIDILVNDFYLFKRVSGAIGYKHKRNRKSGPAHEYGGYKVAAHISISGHEIAVDIRFVGDDYYCKKWEKDMLASPVRLGGILVPGSVNLFYSLLYHALVHKRSVSHQYRQILSRLASTIGHEGELAQSDELLWTWLDEFIKSNGYEYVRPKELSIPLSTQARMRMGIRTKDDLLSAQNLLKNRRSLEAIDLLEGVLLEEPYNGTARKLMLMARSQSIPGGIRRLVRFTALKRMGSMLPSAIKDPIKKLMQ
jgi:predicted Ser/Thr protein kinase